MPHIGDSERRTRNRVIRFFRERLHYTYLGDLHEGEHGNTTCDAANETAGSRIDGRALSWDYGRSLADRASKVPLKDKAKQPASRLCPTRERRESAGPPRFHVQNQ